MIRAGVAIVAVAVVAFLIWFFAIRTTHPGDNDHARDCWAHPVDGRRHCAT